MFIVVGQGRGCIVLSFTGQGYDSDTITLTLIVDSCVNSTVDSFRLLR